MVTHSSSSSASALVVPLRRTVAASHGIDDRGRPARDRGSPPLRGIEEFLRERAGLLRDRCLPPATERLPGARRLAGGAAGGGAGADGRRGELRPAEGPVDGPGKISPAVGAIRGVR